MAYSIIPLILIIASLIAIIFIISKKLPHLSALDIESIIEEKETQIKRKIITERLQRKTADFKKRVLPLIRPILSVFKKLIKKVYDKVIELEEDYKKTALIQKPGAKKDLASEIESMLAEADELLRQEKFDESEKIFIEIIDLDNKNLDAYQGLGELYLAKKEYTLTKETLNYILKLIRGKGKEGAGNNNGYKHRLALCYTDLGLVEKALGNPKKALINLKRAVALEANNPRYLDLMLEICIILKDKKLAESTLRKLKKVNPENQKIKEFKKKIAEL